MSGLKSNSKQPQQQPSAVNMLLNPDEFVKENVDMLMKEINAKRMTSMNGNGGIHSPGIIPLVTSPSGPSVSKSNGKSVDPLIGLNQSSNQPKSDILSSSSTASISTPAVVATIQRHDSNGSSFTNGDASSSAEDESEVIPKLVVLNRVSDGGSLVEYDVDEIPKISFSMADGLSTGEVRTSVNSNAATFSFVKPFTPTRASSLKNRLNKQNSSTSSSPNNTPMESEMENVSFIAGNKGRKDLRTLSTSTPSLIDASLLGVDTGSLAGQKKKRKSKSNNNKKKLMIQGITVEQLDSPLFQLKKAESEGNQQRPSIDSEQSEEEYDDDNDGDENEYENGDANEHNNTTKDIAVDTTLNITNGGAVSSTQENHQTVFDAGNVTVIPVESPIAAIPKNSSSKILSMLAANASTDTPKKQLNGLPAVLSSLSLATMDGAKDAPPVVVTEVKMPDPRVSVAQLEKIATPVQGPVKILPPPSPAGANKDGNSSNVARTQSQSEGKGKGDGKSSSKAKVKAPDHSLAKFGILLSRSSGLDKFASFFQYGALFWGHQPWFAVSKAKNATWRNLEESMSAGKKVMRLFKWIKEMERVQRALLTRDIGPHHTERRAKLAQVLAVMMHSSSFLYYFIDNLVYSSQVGLMNRPKLDSEEIALQQKKLIANILNQSPKESASMVNPGVDTEVRIPLQVSEQYSSLEQQRILAVQQGNQCKKFESLLKDGKNYSSLSRLVVALLYCSLQLYSIYQETKLLNTKFIAKIMEARIITGLGAEYDLTMESEEEVTKDSTEPEPRISKQEEELRKERREKIEALNDFESENIQEIIMSLCNLGILLQRMNISVFGKLPTWFCGVLGVICAMLGMKKNWPVEQLPPKKYKPTVIVPVLTNTNL